MVNMPHIFFRSDDEATTRLKESRALFLTGDIYILKDWFFALSRFKRFFVLLHEHLHWLNWAYYPNYGSDLISKIIDLCILEHIIFGIPMKIKELFKRMC